MKNEEEKMKALLKAELEREAEQIDQEVKADKSLREVTAPAELDEAIRMKIQSMEAEKEAYEKLSPEDKEALRIGREIQMQSVHETDETKDVESTKVVKYRKKKKRKVFLLVAAVAILVLAMGMTSIGGTPFIPQLFEQMLAGRKTTNIDTANEDKVVSESVGEEEAYQEIKDELGFDAVSLIYTPKNTVFLEGVVDKEFQEAYLLYQSQDDLIEYHIWANYQEKAIGYDVEDELLDEYEITSLNTSIDVRQYRIVDSGDEVYIAQFEYENIYYVLRATLEKEEFEKILKNLQFF